MGELYPNSLPADRTVTPFHDSVLVKVLPPPKLSEIIVTPEGKYRPIDGAWAVVVAVGDRDYTRYCAACHAPSGKVLQELEPGEIVLMDSQLSGDVVMVEGLEHRIVRSSELLAVVERGSMSAEEYEAFVNRKEAA